MHIKLRSPPTPARKCCFVKVEHVHADGSLRVRFQDGSWDDVLPEQAQARSDRTLERATTEESNSAFVSKSSISSGCGNSFSVLVSS